MKINMHSNNIKLKYNIYFAVLETGIIGYQSFHRDNATH